MKKHAQGFTLIELLIAVTIIGILAAIAMPAYTSYVTNSKRKQAEAFMLNISQMEERYYTNNYNYYAINTTTDAPPNPEAQGWANYAGNNMGSRTYNLSVAICTSLNPCVAPVGTASATAYIITATPANGFSDSQCQTLTLDSTGAKGNGGTVTSGASPCW
jgi:type IV pilus assembly protein PilE